MTLVLDAAPDVFPVSLEEAKGFLRRGDLTTEDDFINICIASATSLAENFTGRRFITQSWKLLEDAFPGSCKHGEFWPGAILIPYPPCTEITSVKYYNTTGSQITMTEDDDYVVDLDSQPARLIPPVSGVWPSVQYGRPNAVEIIFECGYGAAGSDVEPVIRSALLVTILDLYNNRDTSKLSEAAENLLWPFRDFRV